MTAKTPSSPSAGMGEPVAWQDDPSNDERWNAGLDYGMVCFCKVLGVDPKKVNWDAATEELEGDVCAVIGNILREKYGEDFDPRYAHPETPVHSGGANIDLANKLSGRLDLDVRDWAWHRLTNAEIALIVAALLNPVAHPPLTVPDDGGGELVQPSIADGGQCKEQQPHAPSDLSK